MKNFICTFFRTFIGLLISFSASAQVSSQAGKNIWKSFMRQNVFVENAGQFIPAENNNNGKILFNASQGVSIYWNEQGLTYRAVERYLPEGVRSEAIKEGKPGELLEKMKTKYHFLDVKFLNASPSVQVSSEEKVSYYYTYANPADKTHSSGLKASAYKKIIYKNLYPGIDAEYILPEEGGVKYSLIVHPGADASVVKIKYSGAKNIFLTKKGEIEVDAAKCGNYLEHQPKTFYQGETAQINSSFTLKNGIIGFNIPTYDKTRTLVIDPWITPITPATFPNTNASLNPYATTGLVLDYDMTGNVYVFGGGDPLHIAKYSPAGSLIWVFNQPTVTGFSGNDASVLVGDMCVNRTSGTSYISEGYDDNGAQIYKVSTSGMLQSTFNGTTMNYEISHLRLTCNGKLYCTGGGVPAGLYNIATIDTNLAGPMTGAHITVSPNGDHDVNLFCLDPAGNFAYLNFNYPAPFSADFLDNNDMFKVPLPAFTPSAWVNPGPTFNFSELESMPYAGPSPPYFRTNTFNGIVCGNGFLYTYDGMTLKKWNKSTGAFISQVTTGGKQYWSGGLDLDLCENVYAGVGNAVKVYDANLSPINSYPLTDTSTYDLKVDKTNSKLYITGNSYVQSIDLPPLNPQLTATFTPTTSGCGTSCTGTASASITGANCAISASSFTYIWYPGGQTTSSISNLCPGTYTVIASAQLTCVKSFGDTAMVTIPQVSGGNPPTAQFTPSSPCLGQTTSLTDISVASPNDPISVWNWQMPGGNPSSSTNHPTITTVYNTAGTHTVTLIVTTTAGCKDSIKQQVVVYNPPTANFTGSGIGCAPLCVTNFTDASTSADGNITSWQWNFPGGTPSTSTQQNPSSICYNNGGNYGASLIVTTQYGCSDTISITPLVNVYTWPHADFCVTPQVQPAIDPVFTFCNLWTPNPGVTNWMWDFGDGNIDSTHTSPVHSYSATVTGNDFFNYKVCLRVQTQFGCWDTTCKNVELLPEYEFYIPNTFTPNGDYKNEFFFGKCRGVKEYNIWVFDRWGNLIWDCYKADKNINWDNLGQDGLSSYCQWDGKVQNQGADFNGHSNQLVQQDVYVWKVKLTDVFDQKHVYVGNVNVVR